MTLEYSTFKIAAAAPPEWRAETQRVLPTRVKWEDLIGAKRSRSFDGRSRCNDASLVQHMAAPGLNYNEQGVLVGTG
jgi:hypothetical protein